MSSRPYLMSNNDIWPFWKFLGHFDEILMFFGNFSKIDEKEEKCKINYIIFWERQRRARSPYRHPHMLSTLPHSIICSLLLWLSLAAGNATDGPASSSSSKHTNNWAVLVSASRYWFNYRVCTVPSDISYSIVLLILSLPCGTEYRFASLSTYHCWQ